MVFAEHEMHSKHFQQLQILCLNTEYFLLDTVPCYR